MVDETAIDRLSHALFDSDLVMAGFLLVVADAIWAVMLFWPDPTFSQREYGLMSVLPELLWAGLFAFAAFARCACWRLWKRGMWFASGFDAFLWLASTALIFVAITPPPPAALAGNIVMTGMAAWLWVRPSILRSFHRKAVKDAGLF